MKGLVQEIAGAVGGLEKFLYCTLQFRVLSAGRAHVPRSLAGREFDRPVEYLQNAPPALGRVVPHVGNPVVG